MAWFLFLFDATDGSHRKHFSPLGRQLWGVYLIKTKTQRFAAYFQYYSSWLIEFRLEIPGALLKKDLEIVPEEKPVFPCAGFIPECPSHDWKGDFSGKGLFLSYFAPVSCNFILSAISKQLPTSIHIFLVCFFTTDYFFYIPTYSTQSTRPLTVNGTCSQ